MNKIHKRGEGGGLTEFIKPIFFLQKLNLHYYELLIALSRFRGGFQGIYWPNENLRQNCTTPPNHWDFGIWLGWMSISWDPSQLHAIPNPDHPPLRICLTYQLFCTKKKCPWAFKSSYNIEIWLKVSKFSFSLFWLRFSSGQSRTLIQGRGTREETHYKNRLKTAASHHFKRHWIHWGELM